MLNNLYSKTSIRHETYNSRALITHNFVDKRLIQTSSGALLMVAKTEFGGNEFGLYVSNNNGFTWSGLAFASFGSSDEYDNDTGMNLNGPVIYLWYNEETAVLYIFYGHHFSSSLSPSLDYYRVRMYAYRLTITEASITAQVSLFPGSATQGNPGVNYLDSNAFSVASHENFAYITYVSDSTIYFRQHKVGTSILGTNWGWWETTDDNYFDLISTSVSDEGILDVLAIQDFGATYSLVYLQVNSFNGVINSPVTITNFPAITINDLNIARDGYGNIIALWNQFNTSGTFIDQYYSLSIDNGGTWSNPIQIPKTDNQTDFIDDPTNEKAGRTALMSGTNGFIFAYVRNYLNKSIGYIRTFLSDDGISYELSDEKIAASHPDKDVTGIRFFDQVNNKLFNFNNIGSVRIAYQLGQGNSQEQKDSKPIIVAQKLLSDEAFAEEISDYLIDNALQNQLLFEFNVLGSASNYVDFYEEGLIGPTTEKYLAAFTKFGTSILLRRYDPIQESKVATEGAYSLTEEVYARCFLDDVSYSMPFSIGVDSIIEATERDVKQLHLPPNLFLSRNYILNEGNAQMRTVWLMRYLGNEYELTQLTPKFIDNQIVYYTINAYIIGVNRNPFTRLVLPSET